MKEAIGEANLTVITVILIGIILPVFYVIIPRILNTMQDRSCCIQNNGVVDSSKCYIHIADDKNECTDKTCFIFELSNFRKYCN